MGIERVIIPTDFSQCADKALELAIRFAFAQNIELIVCHINPVAAGGDATFFINAEILDRTEKDVDQSFRELLDRYPELRRIPHKFVQTTGFSVDKIRDVAKEENVDLMIMGTKGRNNRVGQFFGSVTSGIMKRSRIPTLIVPENAHIGSIRKILLALDFEEDYPGKDIESLHAIASIFQSEVYIINVVEDKTPSEISLNPAQMSRFDTLLVDVKHHYHFVNDNNIEHGIISYAREHGIQMVALLGRSYGFVERLFHKSLSKQLTYHTKLPLLILPA